MRRSTQPLAAVTRFLCRSPARAAALVGGALVLAAVAFAQTPAYQARLDALQAKAAAARKRLNLDNQAACTRDPTPEMTFAKVVPARAGGTFTLHAGGHFTKGTEFVFQSDRVHLVRAELKATGATLTGRVDPGTLPGKVSVVAVSPICPGWVSQDAVIVEAATDWTLTLDNGWQVHLTAKALGGDGHDCQARWTGGGHEATFPCVLTHDGGTHFRVDLGTPEVAQARVMKRMQVMSDPEVVKAQTRTQDALAGMDACTKEKDEHRRMACIQAISAKVQQGSEEVKKAQEAATRRALKGTFGCLALALDVKGHEVSVQASSCGYPATHEGHGKVAVR